MFLNKYIIAFFIFSFFGWIWESIYCTIREHKWANRGFLYGPICPIYGFASVLGFIIYDLIKAGYLPSIKWWMIFMLGFIVSMLLEYPTSWALEKLFKARWWDYSDIWLNIKGRTSVPTSLAFGFAAILAMEVLIPLVDRGLSFLPESLLFILSLILVSIISIDTTLTISSLTDFQKYVASIEEAFQNHMTDIVNRVYGNRNSFYLKAIQRIAVFKLPGRKNRIAKQLREKQFVELIKDYYESDVVKQMDNYIQHGTTTTLEHCENVAWISYLINEKLHLNADEKKLVEAAMLHDLYLYDWHDGDPSRKTHGFDHPEIACINAVKNFDVPEKVQEAIRSHMWPLTITKIPKSKEALIICFADKYCALIETIRLNKRFGLRH
ncbi:MAG TPA: HD domain-containing protein [Herbinix luporum]|nr:HD domain-containing protein [Herbinix luporum]